MNTIPVLELLAARGAGLIGKQLFAITMPETCEHGLLVKPPPRMSVDHYMRGLKKAEFRVAVRSTSYERGLPYANQVRDWLHVPGPIDVPGMHIHLMRPETEPAPYRKSVGGYVEFEIEAYLVYSDA